MNQHSRVTVTIVVSLVTLLFSTVCSAAGIYAVADRGMTLDLHPTVGFLMIGLGVVVWVGPPVIWLLPGQNAKRDGGET